MDFEEGLGCECRYFTFTVPLVPHPAAIISPQYRSLHQEMHHPPSASRFPVLTYAAAGGAGDADVGAVAGVVVAATFCWRACDTSETAVLSKVEVVCVGVATVAVCVRECGELEAEGTVCASNSSASCQVVREGCSRHS